MVDGGPLLMRSDTMAIPAKIWTSTRLFIHCRPGTTRALELHLELGQRELKRWRARRPWRGVGYN